MKNRQLLILLIIVLKSVHVFAQLSVVELTDAIKIETCDISPSELDRVLLDGEEERFLGAICYYKNGATEKALELFTEVRQLKSKRQYHSAYWEAKCYADLQNDSLAMVALNYIPKEGLTSKMLSNPTFDELAKNNEDFVQLKLSVEPGLNIWTGLLTVIAVLGLFIGSLLFFGKSKFSTGEKRLSIVLFSISFILFIYLLHWTKKSSIVPYLMNLWQPLTFVIGPSLYFYLKDTFKEAYSKKEITRHYIVPALSFLFIIPDILTHFGFELSFSSDLLAIGTAPILMTAHLIYYALLIRKMTNNEWQIDSNIKIWTKIVNAGMLTYMVAFVSYFVLVRCSFFSPEWDYTISLVMALGILGIGYMGLVQKRVFQSEPISNFLPVKKYKTSSLTENASLSIKKGMERLLQEEQVFKENELRLADLAAYLDVSYHQLSQVINEHYGVNFFELINRYRVEHVKKLLADPGYSHYTILQIAFEAGFNNKASFNRYFKKEIGMTPSAFRIKESSAQK